MKEMLDRALLVVALGMLVLVFDTIAAVSGRVDHLLVIVVFELDIVVVATAAAIAFSVYGEDRAVA
jgi:hypothetical protein